MKMHGPRISGKAKEIGFLHGPIDRVVTIGVIKDVLCRVFDSRKALSRTNLACVASGMRFFFGDAAKRAGIRSEIQAVDILA